MHYNGEGDEKDRAESVRRRCKKYFLFIKCDCCHGNKSEKGCSEESRPLEVPRKFSRAENCELGFYPGSVPAVSDFCYCRNK